MMELIARPLLTAEQVARLLQLKPSTIYDAASRGRIPCVRLWSGNRRSVVRFNVEDIERFIKERTGFVTEIRPDGSIRTPRRRQEDSVDDLDL